MKSLRTTLTVAALSLALAGLSGIAAADGPKKGLPKKGVENKTSLVKKGSLVKKDPDCAKARKLGKACKIEFTTGDTLEGGVASGSGENITAPGVITHSSLIRVRTSFRDLIIRTADNL